MVKIARCVFAFVYVLVVVVVFSVVVYRQKHEVQQDALQDVYINSLNANNMQHAPFTPPTTSKLAAIANE